jgi:hypothetical protein
MNVMGNEVAWDRRRADRRSEGGHSAGDRRQEDSQVARFAAFLSTTLEQLEDATALTAREIGAEAKRMRAELGAGHLDVEEIDGLADRVTRATEAFAKELATQRGELAKRRDQEESEVPSPGAELLVRQMAIAGADAPEIEAKLASLGMEHPHEAIERILSDQPR